jgi:hypothetical protein
MLPSIPPEFYSAMLPDPDLPVLELLQIRFPLVLSSFKPITRESFFDPRPPNVTDITSIKETPFPPLSIVKGLQEEFLGAVNERSLSIRCIHTRTESSEEKTYPLWIITYWAKAFEIRAVHNRWLDAEHHLRELERRYRAKSKPGSVEVVNQVYDALSVLRWDHNLAGFGPSAKDTLGALTSWISNDWLKGEHANQMLELLQTDLRRARKTSVQIGLTWFFEKVRQGAQDPSRYAADSSFRTYRWIGNDLKQGIYSQLAFLANLDRNHWVAAILDFPEQRIWFGDSLGRAMPKAFSDTLDWWTYFHSGHVFTYRKLPIITQQDSFSCCLLAWRALVNFFFNPDHERQQLIDVAEDRLRVFLRILEVHLSQSPEGREFDTDVADSLESDVESSCPFCGAASWMDNHSRGTFAIPGRQEYSSTSKFPPSEITGTSSNIDLVLHCTNYNLYLDDKTLSTKNNTSGPRPARLCFCS